MEMTQETKKRSKKPQLEVVKEDNLEPAVRKAVAGEELVPLPTHMDETDTLRFDAGVSRVKLIESQIGLIKQQAEKQIAALQVDRQKHIEKLQVLATKYKFNLSDSSVTFNEETGEIVRHTVVQKSEQSAVEMSQTKPVVKKSKKKIEA